MRKINEVKGTRFIVEYDQATGQFVEIRVPFSDLTGQLEETADIVPFPEPVTVEPQPLRKAG